MPILIDNLNFKYKNSEFGIFNISFKLFDGNSVAIVGINGSGKTTLIKNIIGEFKPTSGIVKINDVDSFTNQKNLMNDIGYIPGELTLFGDLTSEKLFNMTLDIRNIKDKTYLNELINKFGLDIKKKINKLSKGNKQKVAVILALVHKPKLLILDEPTSGFDPQAQKVFNDLITQLNKNDKVTIFICSHSFEEVSEITKRILFLKDGKIVHESNDLTDAKSIANKFDSINTSGGK